MQDVLVLVSGRTAAAILGIKPVALAARARRGEIAAVAVQGEVMYSLDAIERALPRQPSVETDGTAWFPVPGGDYEVGSTFQVRRASTKKLLKVSKSGAVFLRLDGKGCMRGVRKLLAESAAAWHIRRVNAEAIEEAAKNEPGCTAGPSQENA